MAKFQKGQTVYSKSGTEYRIEAVYDHWILSDGKQGQPIAPHPTKGVRYGVQGRRNGRDYGPYRNLFDTTAFASNPKKGG